MLSTRPSLRPLATQDKAQTALSGATYGIAEGHAFFEILVPAVSIVAAVGNVKVTHQGPQLAPAFARAKDSRASLKAVVHNKKNT